MAIIVEDGTVVTGANSYVSEVELTAYATARGITLVGGTEVLLIQAMDYIEAQKYQGTKSTQAQPLQWPRTGVVIDGYSIDVTTIPNELKNAQMATAVAVDEDNDPLAVSTPGIKMEKVDVIEVEYQDGESNKTYDPRILQSLSKLLANGAGYGGFSVNRV